MKPTPKQIIANHHNAKKSTGPKNTAATAQNALKHGLLAAGITELDDRECYQNELENLTRDYNPLAVVERSLVQKIALLNVRIKRAAFLEAQFIHSAINPTIIRREDPLGPGADEVLNGKIIEIVEGFEPIFTAEVYAKLTTLFPRYECTLENRLYRALHELERIQLRRKGQPVPAPAVVDVTVTQEARPTEEE